MTGDNEPKPPQEQFCEVCGLPPRNKQLYPLEKINGEMVCDVCKRRNEVQPTNRNAWDV